MVDFEREREQFEAIYPRPRDCHWISKSATFYQTEYHAWAAQTHMARWEGWKAKAIAASGVEGIGGPRRGPAADGSQKPNDAAAIPCAKAGSNTTHGVPPTDREQPR